MEFKRMKEKKERGVSVSDVVKDLKENEDMYSDIVVVAKSMQNDVLIGYSVDNDIEGVGMLELAKHEFIDDMRGD